MRGRIPARPLDEVAAAARRVFTDKGFGQAGISDVSKALGLSHGALYTYVESKQALLYLALLNEVRPDAVAGLTLPVTAPPAQEIIDLANRWASDQGGRFETLFEAFANPDGHTVAEELGGIVDELYSFIERNRNILSLVGRCAPDLPELFQWYFVERRRALIAQLGDYLGDRIASGHLRAVPDLPAAARFIVETIAWFAMHRHGDPDSAMLDDEACRTTVRHLLLAAYLPATSETAPDKGSHGHGRDQ